MRPWPLLDFRFEEVIRIAIRGGSVSEESKNCDGYQRIRHQSQDLGGLTKRINADPECSSWLLRICSHDSIAYAFKVAFAACLGGRTHISIHLIGQFSAAFNKNAVAIGVG